MHQPKLPIVALAYDFDGTLAPGNMQEHSFIPRLGYGKEAFWEKVDCHAQKHDMDKILAYMHHMLQEAERLKMPLRRSELVEHGKNIRFFDGVPQWFDEIKRRGEHVGVQVQHFIISSGLQEIIEGTAIHRHFEKVYASRFFYDANDVPRWPALAINYTGKTQYLFRINKGMHDVWDDQAINAFVPDARRPVPFSNIIYIGDGDTDIPAMKMVNYQGGHSVVVYPPGDGKREHQAAERVAQGRAPYMAPADYRPGQPLHALVCQLIEIIAARHRYKRVLDESPPDANGADRPPGPGAR